MKSYWIMIMILTAIGNLNITFDDIYSPIIPNAFKKIQRLPKPVLIRIFTEHHIITTTRSYKNDCCNVIEALNPLAAFVPLTAYIKHTWRASKKKILKSFAHDLNFTKTLETYWKLTFSTWNFVSKIPEVKTRQRRMSCSEGT